jgi:hypothetical protein
MNICWISLTFALHVSGFLLAHIQRQVYNFGSGSSLLGMVSAPGVLTPYPRPICEKYSSIGILVEILIKSFKTFTFLSHSVLIHLIHR